MVIRKIADLAQAAGFNPRPRSKSIKRPTAHFVSGSIILKPLQKMNLFRQCTYGQTGSAKREHSKEIKRF